MFEFGCGWFCGGHIVSHTEHPYLFVGEKLKITYTDKDDYRYFENACNRFQLKDDICNIKIKEQPKPKFDPNTLQDFDKVLVRGEDTNKWRLSFFDTYENGCFCCMDYCYKQCVPYNEETKYLKDTTDEAPDFYQVWK